MENYTSDSSSDADNTNKVLDYSYLTLEPETLDHNLDVFVSDERKPVQEVETIILHHNQLVSFPYNIMKFTYLKTLDVSSNGLNNLPDIFRHCQLLTRLIAKNNNFTNESLPKNFSTSPTLRELNLNGNQLTTFPEQIFEFINLKYLYLGANQIAAISRNIGKLSNLHVLALGGNKLMEVPAALGQLQALQALVLCDNLIESLPANIATLHHLKSLLLHKNQLRTLPPDLILLENLTELSLRENPLVVRFVSDMSYNPASLLELAARVIKIQSIDVNPGDIPETLHAYLQSGHRCVNPQCKGVYFDNRIKHIKFVDFCGKYRIPLLQYICSTKCGSSMGGRDEHVRPGRSHMMRKVLLG